MDHFIGVVVLLEPLNRYEDHMLNTLGQSARMVRKLGHPGVRIMADLFHMNIEVNHNDDQRNREIGEEAL